MTAMDVDIYARISDDQRDDAHGTDNQIRECQAYAAKEGWTVVEVFRDDSVSATKGKRRPHFDRLLDRPVRRPVLVWNTDRLVRVSKELEKVIDQELTVYAIHAGHVDLSTEAGKAVARTIVAWATYEGTIKAQRQVTANVDYANQGSPLWRAAPYGHETTDTEEPRKWTVVESEAAVLREAATRILSSHSVRSVTMWLHTVEGAPTTNAARLLSNPRMVGHNYYKGERIPVSLIDPILKEDDYNDLVLLLSDPARRTTNMKGGKVSTLLTGIAKCGICNDGSTVHGRWDKGKPIYRCASKGHNQHGRLAADMIVSRATVELLTGDDAPEIVARHSTTPASVKEELKEVRSKMAEWESVSDELGAVEYMRVTKPLRVRMTELDEISRQTSHRAIFEGLGVRPEMTLREWYPIKREAGNRWAELPLLKCREIINTVWDITFQPRAKPRGKASEFWQYETVVMVPR